MTIEIHMEPAARSEGTIEDVAIVFSMEQLGRLKNLINSTYTDAQEKGTTPQETRYIKVSGVVRTP